MKVSEALFSEFDIFPSAVKKLTPIRWHTTPSSGLRHRDVANWAGLLVAMLGASLILIFQTATPPPAPATAPAIEFSAERAMVDVRRIATGPHALCTPANAIVSDYLVQRLRCLGLETQTQIAASAQARGTEITGGITQNVIGVLRGRDRAAPALAIQAHHDTVLGSPGASDDTAGVAAALENRPRH